MEPTRIRNTTTSVAIWSVVGLSMLLGDPARTADAAAPPENGLHSDPTAVVALNEKADGYRGIWYMNQPVKNEYRYKYSGGLGTYCDFHQPFAVYRPEVNKTFFCYGGAPADGSRRLLHMVSYFDHKTGTVPYPTLLLDKHTDDAHDNPVMAIDTDGFLWIFSTAHGTSRPAYIHRSRKPYDIDEFELVPATRREGNRETPIDNFSYFQVFYDREAGFRAFFTRYNYPVDRTACFMSSADGVHWSEWKRLAAIERGHYQIGAAGHGKLATMFNMHPRPVGLNARTNLYYMESLDNGQTWRTAAGKPLDVPLTAVDNAAIVRNYQAEQLLAYNKDLQFDPEGRPVLVYVTSRDFEPGPQNERKLSIAHWTGDEWDFRTVTTTDHNYDAASLSFDADGTWRLLCPSEPGPQPYGTGGEMVVWTSADQGRTWKHERQLTSASQRNHSYARRPVNAHPDFIALWADGDARQPSISHLYFCDSQGRVFRLPRQLTGSSSRPQLVDTSSSKPQDPAAQLANAQEKYLAGDLNGALHYLEPLLLAEDLDQPSQKLIRDMAAHVLSSRGEAHFRQAKIAESIADFDRQIKLQPDQAPEHWQRGISYYYAHEYEKGARQFELHQTVNPQDVENAAWHFVCLVRSPEGSVESARKKLIPVTRDLRIPMEAIQQMFAGNLSPEEVLRKSKDADDSAKFYADLYAGLFYEALDRGEVSLRLISRAAESPAAKKHYMGDVARVHVILRKKEAESTQSENPQISN